MPNYPFAVKLNTRPRHWTLPIMIEECHRRRHQVVIIFGYGGIDPILMCLVPHSKQPILNGSRIPQ